MWPAPYSRRCAPPKLYKTRPDVGNSQNDTKRMGGHNASHTNDIIMPIDIYRYKLHMRYDVIVDECLIWEGEFVWFSKVTERQPTYVLFMYT